MGTIAPTPRNRLIGQLADLILGADQYAQKPDPALPNGKANPPLAILSDLIGVGGLGRTLDRLSYGEPITNLGKANVPLIPPDTEAALGAIGPVAGAAGKAAKLAGRGVSAVADAVAGAPVGRTAQRGAIRVGGDPSLMPSHDTSTGNLAATLNNGTMELYAPSIGIRQGELMSGFSGDGVPVSMIPRVGAYDPQNSASTLFNRDAYTPRFADYPGRITKTVKKRMADYGEPVSQASGAARERLDDRMVNPGDQDWLRGAEGGRYTGPDSTKFQRVYQALGATDSKIGQATAIADSPAFRSFEHYENSPIGARLLQSQPNHTSYEQHAQDTAFPALLNSARRDSMHRIMQAATEDNLGSHDWTRKNVEQTLRLLADDDIGVEQSLHYNPANKVIDAAVEGGRKLRQAYRASPSEYAELKVHGPTPLTQENWAGAVLQPIPQWQPMTSRDEQVIQALIDSGLTPATYYDAARALPFDHPGHPFNSDGPASNAKFDLADILQKQAGPARKQPIRP